MKLTRIHEVLKFKQPDWMKIYINFNRKKRKNTAKSFEKKKFKLMINNVYGKTLENLRKRINGRSVKNVKDYKKYVSKLGFVSQKFFNKNLADIYEIKSVLTLYKTIDVGFSVLDLSKLFMYDYHYNCTIRKFNANLLFTDTASLTYEIKTEENIYEISYKDRDLFHFSNYPKDSMFYDLTNMNKIGKIKDESEGWINIELVGLKSKIYSLTYADGKENKKGKGVNSVVVK